MQARIRKAARAILLTPEREVLLMRMKFPWQPGDLWILPGGGIEAGESPAEAVVREIYEETGATEMEVVGEVWRREFLVEAVQIRMKQRYFLVEVERFQPRATELLGDEAEWLQEYRWWALAELADADIPVEPENIASALSALIEDGLPAEPIELES